MNFRDRLLKLRDIHASRGALYNDDYFYLGKGLTGLFPRGVKLKTEEDFNRFALFLRMYGKMGRYARTINNGGHADSMDDIAVYALLVRETDDYFAARRGDDGVGAKPRGKTRKASRGHRVRRRPGRS